jgi:hypothetical protein
MYLSATGIDFASFYDYSFGVSVVSSNLSAMPWPDYKTVAEQICMLRAIQLAVKAYRHAYFIVIYSCDPLWDFLRFHTLRHI